MAREAAARVGSTTQPEGERFRSSRGRTRGVATNRSDEARRDGTRNGSVGWLGNTQEGEGGSEARREEGKG